MRLIQRIRRLKLPSGGSVRQRRLLSAVNNAAEVLFIPGEEGAECSLLEGIEIIARCADVDRICIWRNEIKGEKLYYIKEFSWENDLGTKVNTVKTKTGYSYNDSIPEWEQKLINGECINGPLSRMSKAEQERLMPFGIKTLLAIPTYFQGSFWGFVSFDDCHNERTFTEDEVNILRSGSMMIAGAVLRNEAAAKMRAADERAKLMLDTLPLCCSLWDKDFNNIDCNKAAVKLFGLKSKQDFLSGFAGLSPEYQPDGSISTDKMREYVSEAFIRGRVVFEWLHRKPDGTPVPAEITLVRVDSVGDYVVVGYIRNLCEYKKMVGEIENKDALLHTVNNVAAILLHSETNEFDRNLWWCMSMLAGCASADHVYISKNYEKEGRLYCNQLYEWSGAAEPQQSFENTALVLYDEKMPSWKESLSSGRCINGVVRDMSLAERAYLAPQGILSILVVPVFLQDKFWGFVGFDDCHREREFSQDEESILRCGSLLIANALLRNEMSRNMLQVVN